MTIIGLDVTKSNTAAILGKGDNVSPADMAAAALQAQSQNEQTARDTANSYKQEYGNGISTMVMIYNATGLPLNLRSSSDSSGHIWKYAYDPIIQNGEWSVFIHVHTSGTATGSIAAVGYDLAPKNSQGLVALFAWNNPYSGDPSAFGDVWSAGGYADTKWDSIFGYAEGGGLSGNGHRFGVYGYAAPYSMGNSSSPILEFIVKRTA
jgi:hypothetical protein